MQDRSEPAPSARLGEADALQVGEWGRLSRVVIEHVAPSIDGGRFMAKRVVGDVLALEADIYADGHDVIGAQLAARSPGGRWHDVAMQPLGNDRWRADVELTEIGAWTFTIEAWRDPFGTWLRDVAKKQAAGQAVDLELIEGLALAHQALRHLGSSHPNADALSSRLDEAYPASGQASTAQRLAVLQRPEVVNALAGVLRDSMARHTDIGVWVDRKRAAFSTWYELMPRSQSRIPGRHGTFDDVVARLPEIRDLGFDVLYLTPIHPIGRVNRKGRNNSLQAEEGAPGSPYAIGSAEGGHDAIHPELGGIEGFARLVQAARAHGMEIALDFAVQCAPDHPWLAQHPDWFERRPDGTIKFAENPPKKYEDIVNVAFYGPSFPEVWVALRDVVLFWIGQGVRIFRVDNPHTKPFPFWEWLIREVREAHPDVIFLSEAFTRPKVMHYLAKLGFTQSYSYFTWRNTKAELTDYIEELTSAPSRDVMRPNFFANTPDILPFFLQTGGRAAFQIRLFLAATLGTSYGIYSGFELCEATPVPGKEEYLNSEKYELKVWDWNRPGHIKEDVRRLNMLRQSSPALQSFANVTFYNAWNDHVLYFGKATPDKRDFLLFAVNLDPHTPQGAHFEVPLWEFDLPDDAKIQAEDLVTGQPFAWTGKVQHMWLDPKERPYMIWRLIAPSRAQ
ncbi:MAG: alpha-1,4-glucan--maltose-1-phosphate maltosyltransferase [Hyphomicrobiales bacterium]|nr:MAG: alpha-1,4-glucan--maltose-1-phosphate maltosyltransferase [Hyphomicrobiales bacterium]